MKIANLLISLVLVFSTIIFPLNSFALDYEKEATSSATTFDAYAAFWPLVPGKTMEDPLYSLKLFKEYFGELFSFGDLKKTEHYVTISEKRALEVQKLFIDNKDYDNGKKTLESNLAYLQKAFNLVKKAEKERQRVETSKGKLSTSLENQKKLFEYIRSQIPEEQKSQFDKHLEKIDSFITLLP